MTDIALCPDCGDTNPVCLGPCRPVVEATSPEYADWRAVAEIFRNTRLYQCRNCQIQFRFPAPDERQLSELYERIPVGRWDYNPAEIGGWQAALQLINEKLVGSRQLRILDVGSYDGKFLEMLSGNLQKAAIEPAESARSRLAEKHIQWIGATAESCVEEYSGSFDVITMFDVFEHLPSPGREIQTVSKLLAPGGSLLISTGNCHHWTWRKLKGLHWYLSTLQHLRFGNPLYFQNLASRVGLHFVGITSHPHVRAGLRQRFTAGFESWHIAARQGNGFPRVLAALMQRVPCLTYLTHRESGPYAPYLHDHILVQYRRSASNATSKEETCK